MSRMLAKFPEPFEVDPCKTYVKLEDFAAFHNLPEDLKQKQIESFRFANSVFPFYIPEEHHEINLSSQLKNSKGGEYWGNAAHFLLCNKAHGIPLWKRFEAQIQSLDTTITCRPHISTYMMDHFFQHICSNEDGDLNFIFHNWIVPQLPFQPVLLFQWLSCVVHYLSMKESNMADLYYVPFPEKLKPQLLCLHKMLKTAHRNIGFLFDYLQHQIRCEPDIFVGNLKVFEKILSEIFVFLKFWYESESMNYLSSLLKVRVEHLNPDGKLFYMKRGKMALKRRNFLFNYDFWRGPSPHLKIFGDSNEEIVRKLDTEVNPLDRNVITNHILERDFEPDVVRKVKINSMLQDEEFLTIQRKINQLGEIWKSIFIEISDSGIIGPILANNIDAEFNFTISKLHAWVFKKFKVLPKMEPHSIESFHVHAVKDIIPLIEELKKYKFSLLDVLDSLKQHSQSNQKCLSRRFEARIRTIVLDCIESHLRVQNFEEKKNDVLRDWHVVQYLLPCFVALYVKICESNESKNKKLKNRYAKFLDKLISTYEKNGIGIRKSSWSNVLQDINSFPPLRESYFNNNHEKLSNFFTKVSDLFVQRIMEGTSNDASDHLQCCSLFRAFFEVIQKKTGDLDENDVVATEASAYWNWLMWDLFSRMKDVLEVPE